MDLMASLRALGRQWILTGFLLLLTFIAGVAAWVKIPGPYTTESMVTLLPSQQASKVNGNNPYLSYGGSENIAGDIVLREVMEPSTVVALASRGYTGSYTIADDPLTSGPILDITVTGSSPSVVENTLRAVTAEVQAKLVALQQSLKPANRITSMVVSYDPTAKLEVSKKARIVVLAVGLGLVLTFALPQVLDAELARRRGRRTSAHLPMAEEPQGAPQYPPRRRYRPPTDAPAEPDFGSPVRPLAEPSPDYRSTSRSSVDRSSVDRSSVDRSSVDRSSVDRSAAEPSPDYRSTSRSSADRSSAEPSRDRSSADNRSSAGPSRDRSSSDRSSAEPSRDRSSADRSSADRSSADRSSADRSSSDRSSADPSRDYRSPARYSAERSRDYRSPDRSPAERPSPRPSPAPSQSDDQAETGAAPPGYHPSRQALSPPPARRRH